MDLKNKAHLIRAYKYVFSEGTLQDFDLLEDYDRKRMMGGFQKKTPNGALFTSVVRDAKK